MRIPGPRKLTILALAVWGAALLASPSLAAEEAWGLKAIRAAEAWQTTRGRSETVIAVIDIGFLEKHEQLEPRIASPRSVFSLTGRQVGGPQEIDHGTQVAVIAAGKTLGVCPACSVMPAQVQVGRSRGILRADKFTTDGIINGIYRAIEAGAKVVNMSISLALPVSVYGKGGPLYRALSVPFRAAEEAGITVVFAAGNEGADVKDSAKGNRYCTPYTLCVGGVGLDSAGKIVPADFSNHGRDVDVSAPAVEILSGAADSPRAYERVQGTSFAAPHVAGLAGLIVSAKPDLHPRDIRYAIIASAAGDKAVEKKLRWAVDEDARDEELKLWARAYLLLRGETKAPDRVEEKLKQLLLSLIPQAYAERWYYPEVVIPQGGNTIQGKAVGGLVDAPRAIALAKKLTVPVARPTLDGEQARLAAAIPVQELVRLYELAKLEGSYAGALDPEGLAEIVGPFELRIAKPFDRLEVVRPKSPGKGYSERLVFVAPGSFRHLAALDGKDHGQGTVEVRRFGDFLFVKNPKT
ncbi:MAG: S8 family serine peptidase, partial [Candidatus Rokubacteria bacterium]|nr:S8 family serine peptidase [Candidatus Rokubacteria bacterium]